MSERCSLYIKIKVSKSRLDKFLDARPVAGILNSNLLTWWNSRDMYSKSELQSIHSFHGESNRQILKDIVEDRYFLAKENYDEGQGTWTLIALEYSENFMEIIPIISWIKDMATYLDEDDTGLAMIYNFLWGDDNLMAYMDIAHKQAELKLYNTRAQVDQKIMEEANQRLTEYMDSFN